MSPAPTNPTTVLHACPACGCKDLFVRKAFPQKLGLAIVSIGAIAFVILALRPQTVYIGFIVLAVMALLDLALYGLVPKATVCYRCRAEFRDVPVNPQHGGYELAVGEKYRMREEGGGRREEGEQTRAGGKEGRREGGKT